MISEKILIGGKYRRKSLWNKQRKLGGNGGGGSGGRGGGRGGGGD